MTRQEVIANHRKMWNWIADETERRQIAVEKYHYFDAMRIPGKERPHNYCYCCEYIDNRNDVDCSLCPIEWPTGHCSHGGLFSQWVYAVYNEWHRAAALARQIANLPEKEEPSNETD